MNSQILEKGKILDVSTILILDLLFLCSCAGFRSSIVAMWKLLCLRTQNNHRRQISNLLYLDLVWTEDDLVAWVKIKGEMLMN